MNAKQGWIVRQDKGIFWVYLFLSVYGGNDMEHLFNADGKQRRGYNRYSGQGISSTGRYRRDV